MTEQAGFCQCGHHKNHRHYTNHHEGGENCHCRQKHNTCHGHGAKQRDTTREPSCTCHNLRLPRRLHAASGALFGSFLAVHLFVNSSALIPDVFNPVVTRIHSIINAVPGITLFLVFIPLCIQIISGLYLLHANGLLYRTKGCNRGSTPRFFLQRFSGLVILFFVTMHIGMLHNWGFHAVARNHRTALAGYDALKIFPLSGIAGAYLFLFGVLMVIFHLGNGAVTGAHVWGIIKREYPARFWIYACITVCGALTLCTLTAWYAFTGASLFHI